MRSLFLCALLLGMTAIVRAQGIGAEAGFTMNSFGARVDGANTQNLLKPGFRFGVSMDEYISDNLSFQYGIFYNAKGGFISFDRTYTIDGISTQQDFDGYMRADYVELPLSLLYRSSSGSSGRFFAGGGVYTAVAYGGLVSYENYETSAQHQKSMMVLYPASVGADKNFDDFRMFDAGLQIQAGYELKSGLFTRIHGAYGLVNVSSSSNMALRNINFGMSVGYMLR